VDLVHKAFFVRAGEVSVAERGFGPLLYSTGIGIGAEMHLQIIRGLALCPIFRRINVCTGPRCALHKSGIDDRGFGLFQLQLVLFNRAANLGQKII